MCDVVNSNSSERRGTGGGQILSRLSAAIIKHHWTQHLLTSRRSQLFPHVRKMGTNLINRAGVAWCWRGCEAKPPALCSCCWHTAHNTHLILRNRGKRGEFWATAKSLLFLVNDWTNNPSLGAVASGGCGYPWGHICSATWGEETQEPLGSRIVVGYDNRHVDRIGLRVWEGGWGGYQGVFWEWEMK